MTTFEIDAPFSGAPLTAPAGLVLRHKDRDNERLIHTHNTGWLGTNGGWHGETELPPGEYLIDSIPETQPDTLTRYVQRFRTTALGASYANGIDIGAVHRALEAIGCDDIVAPLSPLMLCHFVDRDLLRALPDGTILRHGVGTMWEGQAWYVVQGNSVEFLFGPLRNINHDLLVVHSIPDMSEPASWVTEPYDPSMQDEIDAFKDRAWELGGKAKRSHSWCGQYEVAMQRMGLTEAWADRPRQMDQQAREALAQGTLVLGFDASAPEMFGVWVRTESGFEHVLGPIGGEPADELPLTPAGSMSESTLRLQLNAVEHLDALPIGTVVNNGGHGAGLTKVACGWTQRPATATEGATSGALSAYATTVTSLGTGVYRMNAEFETDQVLREPEGTTWLEANEDFTSWRLQVREGDGLRTLAEHAFEGGLTTRLVGEPGEMATVMNYQMLEHLPLGTVIVYTAASSRDAYVKRAGGWAGERNGGLNPARTFNTAVANGGMKIESIGEPPSDARVGQAITPEMVDDLPVGTRVFGQRSQAMYTVTERGMQRDGRSETLWDRFEGALTNGRLIIESIPAENHSTEVPDDPRWTVGQRLTDYHTRQHEIDEMPVGSQLTGLGSGFTYTRVAEGWTAAHSNGETAAHSNGEPVNGGHVYPSSSGFTGYNCTVARVGAAVAEVF